MISRKLDFRLALLGVLATAACGPDLDVSPGDRGNLTGVWIGTIRGDVGPNPVVLWLEQGGGEQLAGTADLPTRPPESPPPAGSGHGCDLTGSVADDVAALGFSTDQGDLLLNLAYDAATETLAGKWGADTQLADISGTVKLTRRAWLPTRFHDGKKKGSYQTILGCLARPAPQCADGKDNDNDGLVDADDPACCPWGSGCLLAGNDEAADPTCADGKDNDGDGLTDAKDPECGLGLSREAGWNPACSDGRDNDGDGLVDTKDPACKDASGLSEVPPMCADGKDNDGDGLTDAKDPQCQSGSAEDPKQRACANGYDDDGDGLVDLKDPSCHNNPLRFQEAPVTNCDDGLDNDGDGKTDLAEAGCKRYFVSDETGKPGSGGPASGGLGSGGPVSAGLASGGGACEDGKDNDGDGLVDAKDPQCVWIGLGSEIERPQPSKSAATGRDACSNRRDDDGDGLVDAADTGCKIQDLSSWKSARFESVPPCLDGVDNDGDGLVDFKDPDCGGPFDTSEAPGCSNGLDDDGDGLIDLKDPGCFGDRRGHERQPQCADGTDNDGDGLVDGKDPHCVSEADETETAACGDRLDNDGDGFVDLADSGCSGSSDDTE